MKKVDLNYILEKVKNERNYQEQLYMIILWQILLKKQE